MEKILEHFLGEPVPQFPTIAMDSAALSEYAGVYAPVGSEHQLTVDPPGLVLQTIAGPGMLSDGQVKPLAPSPVTLRFHDRDRVIGVSSAGLRSKGEFLRDSTGEIEWFRWGGRIARRQTASK